MILLEFNDAQLSLYRDGKAIYRQPAIAHVGADGVLFGSEALNIARLHPQQANQQYLARLNADPLSVTGKLATNHADLTYLHLLELRKSLGSPAKVAAQRAPASTRTSGSASSPASATSTGGAAVSPGKRWTDRLRWFSRREPDAPAPARRTSAAQPAQQLLAAVPGSLTADQLGVLLGIAEEAGIDIRGFVDSALLMASTTALPERCWVLDLHLTRACLSELRTDEEVSLVGCQDLPGCGLLSCLDGWANLLADRFVQDTRFDPLHAADTEQQLYNQLYAWAGGDSGSGTAEDDFEAEIRHDGHERRTRAPAAAMRRKLTQRFQPLAQKLPAGAQLLVAPRSAALPGLLSGLRELSIQAQGLPADALATGFARHAATIADGPPTLVTRLRHQGQAAHPQINSRPKATHVLLDSQAWPLDDNPFGLPNGGRAGDRIGKDGRDFRLIAVAADADAALPAPARAKPQPGSTTVN